MAEKHVLGRSRINRRSPPVSILRVRIAGFTLLSNMRGEQSAPHDPQPSRTVTTMGPGPRDVA